MDVRTAMEEPLTRRPAWVVDGDARQLTEVEMALEEPLVLAINGAQAAILMRLPGMEKELAVGFCLSEGLVQSLDDIMMIHHCGRGLPVPGEDEGDESSSRNRVELRVRPEGLRPNARLDVVRLIRAGCGAVDVDRAELPLAPVGAGPRVTIEAVRTLGPAMRDVQRVHRDVGGVHAAALFDAQGGLIILCEDVGRHNAVDKAFGHCLLHGIALPDKVLVCSGRLSYEMVTKAARMGLTVLVSMSAPTALGAQIADAFGVTVIGYLRGARMTVYTHPERVLGLEG